MNRIAYHLALFPDLAVASPDLSDMHELEAGELDYIVERLVCEAAGVQVRTAAEVAGGHATRAVGIAARTATEVACAVPQGVRTVVQAAEAGYTVH